MSGGHHHNHSVDEDSESKTKLVVAITLVMMVNEVGVGYMYNSIILLVAKSHIGTYAATLGITFFTYY